MHHLDFLRSSTPPSLLKTAQLLGKQLHPAFVDDDFRSAAQALGDHWRSQVCELLIAHYNKILRSAEDTVVQNFLPSDLLPTSLGLVKKWATKQLGRRLKTSSLDRALDRINALQPTMDPTPSTPPPVFSLTRSRDFSTQTYLPSFCDASTAPATVDEATSLISFDSMPNESREVDAQPVTQTDVLPPSQPPVTPTTATQQGTSTAGDADSLNFSEHRRSKKRVRESTTNLTQLDLFGATLVSEPPPRRRALAPTPAWKKRVVCGDSNLLSFEHENCLVLAHERGRLSHFKELLRSSDNPDDSVESFVICLSALDKGNCFVTNQTSLKAVLGAAGRLFPKAKCFVQLCGISDSYTPAEKLNIQDLNNYVILKSPSSCIHIPAPSIVSVEGNLWSSDTRIQAFTALRNFLN